MESKKNVVEKKKMEFSKKITIWVCVVFAFIVMILSCVTAFVNSDFPLVGVIGTLVGIPIVMLASYAGKAGYENGKKISNNPVVTAALDVLDKFINNENSIIENNEEEYENCEDEYEE
jgi:uncharacterized membrane-anchored protein